MIITPFMRTYRKTVLRRKLGPKGLVSVHFRHIEFWTKDGTPIPIKSIEGLKKHCQRFLEPMRAKFGPCTVMSGYRHERYNRSIGGATDSRHDWDKHPTSVATDLIFAKGTPDDWGKFASQLRTATGGKGGIGIYPTQGFIHVDSRDYKADWRG